MGQVEFQPEPIISEADKPSVADFPSESYPFSQNPESDLPDIVSVLNAENIVLLNGEDKEYSGWVPDGGNLYPSNRQAESGFKRALKRVAVPAGGALAAVLVACGGGSEGSTDKTQTTSPTQTEAATTVTENTPTPEPTSSPSIEPTREGTVDGKSHPEETATNTPSPEPTEVVVETPCQILPQEFCDDAELLLFKTGNGDEQLFMLGFKNLPAGTPIMVPSDSIVNPLYYGENNGWKGMGALVDLSSDGNTPGLIIGDISFGDSRDTLTLDKGEVISTIQGSGLENYGYNLLIAFGTRAESGLLVSNKQLYESLFPGIINKEPIGVIEQSGQEVVLTANHYIDE